ncbi:MAG: hypothetical protein ACLQVM_23470 [Terriglobia bacterium]
MRKALFRVSQGVIVLCLAVLSQAAAQEPNLTEQEMKQFLLQAKVINYKHTSKGVTSPWRLTLSDGKLTHDASFQTEDDTQSNVQMQDGRIETVFRDTYHFNIAAYELAKLVGVSDMIPVYVFRKWNGESGSLSWWVPSKMDEEIRIKQNIQPPDMSAWNRQVNKMYVFTELVYDTDRNATNMLITEDWKLWMIDFSRAFRPYHDLREPKHLGMCDRHLLANLRQLREADVLEKTKPHLTKELVKAVMARRDKIVAFYDQWIAQKGESAVLY